MEKEQRQLDSIVARGVLPQVMLFCGADVVSTRRLLLWLLQRMFCQQNSVCGACVSCSLLANGRHMDVAFFDVEAEKFGVKEVGHLQTFLSLRAYERERVAVIFGAHRITVQSANKLLKILEEPSGSIFLSSDSCGRILPTVRSRCFQFLVHTNSLTDTCNLPFQHEFAELEGIKDVSQRLAIIKKMKENKHDLQDFLVSFERYLHRCYLRQMQKAQQSNDLQVRIRRKSLHALKHKGQINLNLQLCMESVLLSSGES